VAFLTKDLVVLAHDATNGDLYMEFNVWSLAAGRPLYRCKLPFPVGQYRPCFLTHPASKHSGRSPTRHAKIFIPDPTVEILGMEFHSIPVVPGAQSETVTVALSIHLFIQKCQEVATSDTSEVSQGNAVVLEWEQWGPSVMRWFPKNVFGNVGVRTTFGSRMLALRVATVWEGGMWINRVCTMVMDFNPRPILRGAQDVVTDDYEMHIINYENKWEAGDISVTSALPCRVWISMKESRYLSLFLDGNTVIGRLVSEFCARGIVILLGSQGNAYHWFSFLPRTQADEGDVPPRTL
jgi:hypothetical protein